MKKMSETIVFFGSGPVAAETLQFLSHYFTIEVVITKPVPGHHKQPAPVEVVAKDSHLPVAFAGTKLELDKLIKTLGLQSRLGLIVDYGVIVSAETIKAFELGIVNSHFSLLPQWRGADPITFAILSGQAKTGVSLMVIEPALDTGKLITQKSLTIQPDDTTPTLTEGLIKLSNQLLVEYLPRYVAGTVKPHAQPHPHRATYSRKLTKEDGVIDWTKPAEQLEREIRAFIDWPKSRTTLAGKEVIITKAHAISTQPPKSKPGDVEVARQTKALAMVTGKGSLWIQKLKPIGKPEMADRSFINGYLT
ncbi:methionyl-tRNA formyltransferase [Candidatus Saccharibacteria bacterium]|nr:methionyl-tRNA formyltransferase [Candidatus Saccharibacteria bacterium]